MYVVGGGGVQLHFSHVDILLSQHYVLKRLLPPWKCPHTLYHSFQLSSYRKLSFSILFNKMRIYQNNRDTYSCDALLICSQPSRPGYPSPRSSEGFHPSPQHMVQTNHYQVYRSLLLKDVLFYSSAHLGVGKYTLYIFIN